MNYRNPRHMEFSIFPSASFRPLFADTAKCSWYTKCERLCACPCRGRDQFNLFNTLYIFILGDESRASN